MNAFTSHEYTAFYVRVPDERLELALDILSDVVWSPTIDADEMDAERQVILEEINMRDDAPDELLHDLLAEAVFPDHPLGRSVLGSTESITGMSRDDVAEYHAEHYHPSNVVVAAAGNLEHDRVVELVERGLAGARRRRRSGPPAASSPFPPSRSLEVLRRPTEQAHLAIGLRALSRDDPDRFALTVLNQVLGGGMSSRLFQEVREKRGLAYSVYAYRAAYEETGAMAVYAGTTPARVTETLGVLDAELDRVVADGGVSDRELDAAKGHLTGSMALGARELVEPDAPPRPQRAHPRRDPHPRRARRLGERGHARRRRTRRRRVSSPARDADAHRRRPLRRRRLRLAALGEASRTSPGSGPARHRGSGWAGR